MSTSENQATADALRSSADLWSTVRQQLRAGAAIEVHRASATAGSSVMESGVLVITALSEAPPRTLHSAPLVRSSPLPPSVRALLETREIGRPYDATAVDLDTIPFPLPGLECPAGDVLFLANDSSLEALNLSVDVLLQHRKKLLARSVDPTRPRRHVFVLGAGPGGLMSAVQLGLRGHRVVVCEQREVYSRNRYIGVYKEVTHLMAALGMPESMTYDFSQYRGKRGIMLADIQTFLHGIALKLGVVIYTGAVPRTLNDRVLRSGEIELQRAARGGGASPGQSSVGMTRWQHDTVARVRSGVTIRFDTVIEATGGRSGLRELLVGPENVVSVRTLGRAAAAKDPSLTSFFEDPEDHCAEYVESGYGCPPGLREKFATALLAGGEGEIPDEVPCFVSNIDASIFTRPMKQTPDSMGLASQIGDRKINIPHDWVVLECRLADQSLSRYHIEGPLPQTFEFGGKRVRTRDFLDKLNPVSFLFRILYAMGVPFDAVDRRRLIEFYTAESSSTDASDIVSTWVGAFRTLRLGGDQLVWCGKVRGSDTVEYAILGEALQNAWYRFGVGVDDTFAAAVRYAEGIEFDPAKRLDEARRFERVMTARSVQVLYHLYGVARNTDQGVVGPVLTEYHMDDQHSADVAEARLRDLARQGTEMLAAANDLRGGDPLLETALDYQRECCCRRVQTLLESLHYKPDLLAQARQPMKTGDPEWRSRAFATLEGALSPQHRELIGPLFARAQTSDASGGAARRAREARLAELGLGRYDWASPWMRACALRSMDSQIPTAADILTRAAGDSDPLISETAKATLASSAAGQRVTGANSTIEKVLILKDVTLFKSIPHEVLARVALLLTDRWVAAGEGIFNKSDLGDCLYVIASGKVRVHDGDRTFKILNARDFFGELSLLDAEARSASVSAVEQSHLLRLGQADFYVLLGEQPEITLAINRALCQMVRTANAS